MKYTPIPQWTHKNNGTVGEIDLWLVHTDFSDCWIRRTGTTIFQVFDYDLTNSMLICESMEESVQFIKELAVDYHGFAFVDELRKKEDI